MSKFTYQVKQRSGTDPKRVVTATSAPTLKVYKCTKCGEETNQFSTSTPFCDKCSTYMVPHKKISDSKVQNIMNRKLDYDTPIPVKQNTIEDAWDDGLIARNVVAEVRPISGSGTLKIEGRTSKSAWIDKVVKINGGWYRLADIGKALGGML